MFPPALAHDQADQDTEVLTQDHMSVDGLLADFLKDKERSATDSLVPMFIGWLWESMAGGKRLRPWLCHCGWQAVGAQGDPAAVTHVAASLELFHAFALIHDDVMDGSDTRRGKPTTHRMIAAVHPEHPDPERFGANTALLLGSLALGWSYDLVYAAGLDQDRAGAVWRLLDTMRVKTLTGQYLDLLSAGSAGGADGAVEEALAVCRRKTGMYTVTGPLRLGALLSGADERALDACTAYGVPLGEAFQLRDDLLGVFGDSATTGKSTMDDLREGKRTVLLALAWHRADSDQRRRLGALVGDRALDGTGAAEIRRILTVTGARDAIENMIVARRDEALAVLDSAPFHPAGAVLLRQLATKATQRER